MKKCLYYFVALMMLGTMAGCGTGLGGTESCVNTSYTSKCPTLTTCGSSSGSGSYTAGGHTYSWSSPSGVTSAANSLTNACI